MTNSTSHLTAGTVVVTSQVDGDDFGIPLVSPTTRGLRNRTTRVVRSVVGGVVRFEDGTKTRPLHGRTAWQLAEVRCCGEGDPSTCYPPCSREMARSAVS